MNRKKFFVFDVESIGLHGEGYAVAGGVYFEDGTTAEGSEFVLSCPASEAAGDLEDRKWVYENVPFIEPNCKTPKELREYFWALWITSKAQYPGLVMAAECGWPVEGRFLIQCVQDHSISRKWEGPYPLHEIASFMQAAGMDPIATYERLPNEMPKHHPLGDARQSARLLREALKKLSA